MPSAGGLRALLQDAGSAVGSVFVDAGSGSAAASNEPEKTAEQWSTRHSVGPSGATIGIVCAVVVVLLVVATITHWLHRSGRLPWCSKFLEEATDDEPTFLQARHPLPLPAAGPREPPPVVVLMPDDEVEIAVTEQQKRMARPQQSSDLDQGHVALPAYPPAFWVVDADQQHSQASDSPRSEGFQQGRRQPAADSQAVPLLHRPAPRAGMQRRQKAAPSDSFVYMI